MLDLDDITYIVVGHKSFSRSLFKIILKENGIL